MATIDTIQFVYSRIARPEQPRSHPYHSHYDLDFDREAGQADFRKAVNRIFARNGVAFTLLKSGRVRADGSRSTCARRRRPSIDTGDEELDGLLAAAVEGILEPQLVARRRGLEQLWDAWERLKSYRGDKRSSISWILQQAAADNDELLRRLEAEAKALTDIGNNFRIRHHERGKVKLEERDQVDYLFWRLLVLIRFLIPHLQTDE